MWNERVQAHLILIFSLNTNLESVPIDPLVFKSFKLEVSEKLQQG